MNSAYGTPPAPAQYGARHKPELRVAGCPEPACRAPAEIYAETVAASTDGPVRHARTRCLRGHIFLLPVERIPGL